MPERRAAFEIALRLGMTVDEMLDRMSSEEFQEWVIFLEIKAQEEQDALDNA